MKKFSLKTWKNEIFSDNVVLKINKSGGLFCGQSPAFDIVSPHGPKIGEISKNYGEEDAKNADTFGAKFPKDLCVKMKCVLIAAVFLIVSI